MTTPSVRSARWTARIGILAVALFVAACGTSATTSPSIAPAASASAVSTPADPTATPTADPSLTPEPTAEPPPGLEGTRGRITDPVAGYAITLPKGWFRIDLTAAEIGQISDAATELSPDFAAMLEDQAAQMAMAGIRFWAFDEDAITPEFATNATILTQQLAVSLDLLETVNVAQLSGLDALAGTVKHEQVELPSGKALHFVYALLVPTSTGTTVKAIVEQYMLIHDGSTMVVTFSGQTRKQLAKDAKAAVTSLDFAD